MWPELAIEYRVLSTVYALRRVYVGSQSIYLRGHLAASESPPKTASDQTMTTSSSLRLSSSALLLLALILAAGASTARAADDDAAKFVPLFDGKSFDGWEGDMKVFRIEDGAVVGGSLKKSLAQNEFLATTKEYGDFELRLKVKLIGPVASANGGIQIPQPACAGQSRDDRLPGRHGPALLGQPLR